MTSIAAALLADVPRYRLTGYDAGTQPDGAGPYVSHHEVLAALTRALDPALTERAGEVLEGVTPGPWAVDALRLGTQGDITTADGEICIAQAQMRLPMASGKKDTERAANARFIAWARNNVPALLTANAALRARIEAMDYLRPIWAHGWTDDSMAAQASGSALAQLWQMLGASNQTEAVTKLRAAEAEVEKLRGAADWQEKRRRDAFTRRHIHAPEDPHVAVLCERYGYGAVMDAASRLWARKDSVGAFYIGGCIGIKPDVALTTEARHDG